MPDFLVFGDVLRSDLDFPELAPARDGEPRWRLIEASGGPPPEEGELLGSDVVDDDVTVRLFRTRSGLTVQFDDTGSFLVDRDGREIRWRPGPDPDPEKVRADVLGPVLAAAQHAAGRFCLHGSAVTIGNTALALLGPKHHGKSTLALALVERGARLLTDDSLPVDLATPAAALPGVHSVRVWDDSHRRFEAAGSQTLTGAGGKNVLAGLPLASLAHDPAPLGAIYLLRPVTPEPGAAAARRAALPATMASLALVHSAKIGALAGRSEAAVLLERATALAEQVPVYTLSVARDFEQLDDVVMQLFDWHGDGDPCGAVLGAA